MGKMSAPGLVKTRLAPHVTPEWAARLNTAFLQDAADNVIAAGRLVDVAAYAAYAPVGGAEFFRDHLPGAVGLISCSRPTFGDCLFHALETLLANGHGAACVLNSDSPTLPTAYLTDAALALAMPGDRIVLGPSEDGGYYLLGVKQTHRQLFEDIPWSTSDVCRRTAERAAEIGCPITLLSPWYDVDDAESLSRLTCDLEPQANTTTSHRAAYAAPHTRAVLNLMRRSTPPPVLP